MPAPETLANVARIRSASPVYASSTSPRVIGTVPAKTRTDDTWLPVLGQSAARTQVRWLDGRTMRTGWLPNAKIEVVPSGGSWVEIFRARRTITIHAPGRADRTETVLALGDARSTWPTPVGVFFTQNLVTGKKGGVYGVNPYTETSARSTWSAASIVSIHGWTGPPGGSSHGCVRLRPSSTALNALAGLPLGTTVVIRP